VKKTVTFCPHISLGKNKTLEIQFGRWKDWYHNPFDIGVEYTRNQDHAGFRFNFDFRGFHLYFSICDNRHWNHEKNRWCNEKDAEQISKKFQRIDSKKETKPEVYEDVADYYTCRLFSCSRDKTVALLKHVKSLRCEINKMRFFGKK